jgi:hypothetical protein
MADEYNPRDIRLDIGGARSAGAADSVTVAVKPARPSPFAHVSRFTPAAEPAYLALDLRTSTDLAEVTAVCQLLGVPRVDKPAALHRDARAFAGGLS